MTGNFKNIIIKRQNLKVESKLAYLIEVGELEYIGVPKRYARKLPSGDLSVGIVSEGKYNLIDAEGNNAGEIMGEFIIGRLTTEKK